MEKNLLRMIEVEVVINIVEDGCLSGAVGSLGLSGLVPS